MKRFYNLLFNINFSNIIFSDKIIMYEGDTERMFIQSVLEFEEFEDLSNQYIAFVQVGRAYAHKYKKLIEYLGIKTLIITDIDYGKKCSAKSEVLKDTTTNAAIKDFYKDENEESNPTINKIFKWKKEKYKSHKAKRNNSLIRIEFQDEEDFYARTFEEAMLSKYFGINIGEKRSNNSWEEKRDENNLKFSIPNQGNEFNVREIVDSTSNSKTNFIYSVIINDLVEEMLPSYIKEGLKWLEK